MRISIKILLVILPFVNACSEKAKRTYHENGKVESEIRFINDSTNVFLSYYADGMLRDSLTIIDGYLKGRGVSYFSSGKLEKDCYWNDGLLNGPCSTYYPSGNLESASTYRDSIVTGNTYEYYDSRERRMKYEGNYSIIKGKKWMNYQTWYDSLGNTIKATTRLLGLTGAKSISLNDSLKITFELDNLEYPLLRVFVGDYDKDYNIPDSARHSVFDGKGTKIICYIKPKKVGYQTARGYIQNYEVLERFKNGLYKTRGKDIYWSYDYNVTQK